MAKLNILANNVVEKGSVITIKDDKRVKYAVVRPSVSTGAKNTDVGIVVDQVFVPTESSDPSVWTAAVQAYARI